ncbi:MAG TPA: glycosyl hydrolase [Opitutaceae bacterium]|nr:glycosyl hydrolase [Opitutaceae bacterium]
MNPRPKASWLLTLLLGLASPFAGAAPVTPHASPEAVALLQLLSDISGKYTLSGQHNFPNVKSRNSEFAAKYIGRTPVIWGTDWGHAKAGDSDSYLARPDIVKEAIRQHEMGSIIAICWHAVPPTADEPITFRELPGSDPKALRSVQGKLLDEQFKDVLTPGTPLYNHWCAQVDEIAVYLKQLQDAHVPVLWRPYHEMNGDWFWWGGRTGQYSTAALYRQIFDRLVNVHHLNNLVWVWSMDRPSTPARAFANFFPGTSFVDVLSLDVYGNDFAKSYYDALEALAAGKPVALAEVGNPPAPDVLEQQPGWAYYMTWAGMVRNTSKRQYNTLLADTRVLSLEDKAYAEATAAYRKACGLAPLSFPSTPANFSGTWVLDEEKSDFGKAGSGMAAAKLEVVQDGLSLSVKTTRAVEYADDQVSDERMTLDGSVTKSEFMNSPRVVTARLEADGTRITIDSTITMNWGQPGAKIVSKDTWELIDGGTELSIHRVGTSMRGVQDTTMVFDRR